MHDDSEERKPPQEATTKRDAEETVTYRGRTLPQKGSSEALLRDGERFGDYRIRRLLGRGGMGEVYEAEHGDSGKLVALKLLGQRLDDSDRKRFLREGRLAASVSHPNSVYIYATEEIEGVPVISMEYVPGGTLRDRVLARGPLEPVEAVDVTLQLVDGLEAAGSQGVLHRDIKPANCFVAEDGTSKVGDFGLSMSLEADEETRVTMTGTVLGTPSYASPEQLKAEELDVRSDIYSLGATLYYLLTGRAPFEETNLTRLISHVLSEAPRSPREYRQEVSKGLAACVLCCLEKDPAARYADYDELRQALAPFGSLAPAPAALGPRLLAGLVDTVAVPAVLLMPLSMRIAVTSSGEQPASALSVQDPESMLLAGGLEVLAKALYFLICEGLWGAGLGKAIFGLRVVSAEHSPARWHQVGLRALLFCLVPALGLPLYLLPGPSTATLVQVVSLLALLLTGLLFVTARRRNGWATLHGLLSRTRVVRRRRAPRRLALEPLPSEPSPSPELGSIGGYEIVRVLAERSGEKILQGFDPGLRRGVWIRRYADVRPHLPDWRRVLARPGRLRWIDGRRAGGEAWDVYEAIPGRPLTEVATKPSSWLLTRQWLLDLARELQASGESEDDALVPSLERVWIGTDGRARLLEFSLAGGEREGGPDTTQAFLHRVALSTLEGRLVHDSAGSVSVARVPERARRILEKLGSGGHESLATFVDELEAVEAEGAEIGRLRRLLPAAGAFAPGLFLLFVSLWLTLPVLSLALRDPESVAARLYLKRLQKLQRQDAEPERLEALERYTAGRFRVALAEAGGWPQLWVEERELARELRERYPSVSEEELEQAAATAAPWIETIELRAQTPLLYAVEFTVNVIALLSLVPTALIALLVNLVVPWGLLLRLGGMAVSDTSGLPASRWRALRRALLVWLPGLVPLALLELSDLASYGQLSQIWSWYVPLKLALLLGVFLAYAVGLAFAVWRPERGPQDWLAGTQLVRR